MIGSARQSAVDRRHTLERTLAPHVDVLWADPFVLELTRSGVEGPHVVAALTDVEARCVESGQHPRLVLGEPVAYARGLGLARSDDVLRARRTVLAYRIVPIAIGIAGMLLVVTGAASLRDLQDVVVTSGMVVSAGLVVLAFVGLVRFAPAVLRLVGAQPVVAVAVLVGLGCGLGFLPALVLDEPILTVDALVMTALGGVLALGGASADLTYRRLDHPARPLLPALVLPAVTALLALVTLLG